MDKLKKLTDGLYFGEGPRWHENKLWFSDFYSHKVMTLDENNLLETVCEVPNQPSGFRLVTEWRSFDCLNVRQKNFKIF